jgi:hypothetical protein
MKLEIKHLAPYLPYSVRITKDDWGKVFKLDNDGTTLNCVGIDYVLNVEAKPILRPLSDIAKVFEAMEEDDKKVIMHCDYLLKEDFIFLQEPYFISQILFKYHFDIFGLIDQNLAIDINTLNLK